jgi:hypothetical protein
LVRTIGHAPEVTLLGNAGVNSTPLIEVALEQFRITSRKNMAVN